MSSTNIPTTHAVRNIMREYNVESHNIWTNTYRNSRTVKCFANVFEAHAIKMECEALNLPVRIDVAPRNINLTRYNDMFGVIVNI